METKKEKDPKQRILEAAVDLFAGKGFSATGVREIAKQAEVNVAMISYYYGSKLKVLEAIVDDTFDSYFELVRQSFDTGQDLTLEQHISSFFKNLITVAREQQKLLRVFLSTLHFDIPEFAEFKAAKIKDHILPLLAPFFQRHASEMQRSFPLQWIGPTLHGMVMFHFLVAPVFSRATNTTLDDAFYDDFTQYLTELTLYGLVGKKPE